MQVHSELKGGQLENKSTTQAHSGNQVGLMQINTTDNKVQITHNTEVENMATEKYVEAKATEIAEAKKVDYIDIKVSDGFEAAPPLVDAGYKRLSYSNAERLNLDGSQVALKSDVGIVSINSPAYSFGPNMVIGENRLKIATFSNRGIYIIQSVNCNSLDIQKVGFEINNSYEPSPIETKVGHTEYVIGKTFLVESGDEMFIHATSLKINPTYSFKTRFIRLNENL